MKHSIFLKSVAILLCAASLLTLIGSGLGIWCMVELDLYDKTVEQFMESRYEADAQHHAQMLAYRYAGRELGGLPEDFLENEYPGWYDQQFGDGGFGYAILDAEGNILASKNEDVKTHSHQAFSFPVEGNYMHLVHAEPKPSTEVDSYHSQGLGEGKYGIIDNVREGTVPVYFIQISYDGGSEGVGSPTPLGFLERLGDGSVQFQASEPFSLDYTGDTEITHITFMGLDEQILYEIADSAPVAIITETTSGGSLLVLLDPNESTDSPANTPIYRAIFYGADGITPVESLSSTQPIGEAYLDDSGHLNFRLFVESNNLKDIPAVTAMTLMDKDGTVLFGESNPQIRTGIPLATPEGLCFSTHPDAVAVNMPAEPIPVESIPETVPEEVNEDESQQEPEAHSGEDSQENQQAPAEDSPADTLPPETVAETVPETISGTIPETIPVTIPVTVAETIPAATLAEPSYRDMKINGKSVQEYNMDTYTYYDPVAQNTMTAKVVYVPMPAYTVEIFIQHDADRNSHIYDLLHLLKYFSPLLLPLLLGSLLLLAITIVFLCVSAGHQAKTSEIRAGGLNRIPLDLYFILDFGIIYCLVALTMVCCTDLLQKNLELALILTPLAAYSICLVFVGFCFALVAQCKTPGGYWWRNSICGRLLTGGMGSIGKLTGWSVAKFFPWLWQVVCNFWDLCLLLLMKFCDLVKFLWGKLASLGRQVCHWLFNAVRRFVAILPLTWQWMLGGAVLLFLGLLVWANRRDGWGILWLLVGFAAVLYLSQCFGILLGAAKRMTKGDLETKINDKRMIGCFREFAKDLNNLADVVTVAAQKQLRSERMKTELITNVSHDIKTPLTSIINYVDLLQKPHTEEEGQEYLEVLDRQSQRLKKLIDDLMDMSKANTGNMHAEITRLDAVESVNQALGEFADKLEKAELTPVFRHNTDEAFIMADGKLVWRVLSNLLGNAVKYAMPGTRLYLDLMNLNGRVILSLKNISRDELNVNAEELMERFVRGDDSRNTEGSGLGLNIAKSLMELQKGHLQLLVDGDLFKVTLVFPSAE